MIKGGYQLIDLTEYDFKYNINDDFNLKGIYEKVTCGKPIIVKLNVRDELNTNENSTIISNMSVQIYEFRCSLYCIVRDGNSMHSVLTITIDTDDNCIISFSEV